MVQTDYTFYTGTYKGKAIPTQTDFDTAEVEAAAYVNALTRGKANNLASVPDEYKLAICAVADVVYNATTAVTSESVGNHSVSYASKTTRETEQDKARKACMFLNGTGLLYSGLNGGGL